MAKVDARQKLEQLRKKAKKTNPKTKAATAAKAAPGKVKDLRQLISKKKQVKGGKVTTGAGVRTTGKTVVKDLRDSNRKLASRKKTTPAATAGRPTKVRSVVATRSATHDARAKNTIQYYVPPHLQQIMQQLQQPHHQQPAYMVAQSHGSISQGASVLVSNLVPSITQSEIIELFGDIGELTAVNMINQTTALVTYQRSSDALKAVRNYHNRSLDDRPMYVNMMPALTLATNNKASA